MENNSILKKIGFASFIMMASVFASRVIGFVRIMVIAGMEGTSTHVDAYLLSFVLPEILNHVVASGFLSITFIPIFTKYLTKNEENEGWKVFSIIFNSFGLLLILFILFSLIFTNQLVHLIAPGITDPVVLKLVIKMTRIIIPAQFFFFAGGLFMAAQFAKEKFFIPALAPLVYNIGIISGGILLHPWIGIEGFAWGALFGAFIGNFLIQYFGAKKINLTYYFSFNFLHSDFKKYIILSLPFILGATMTFSSEIVLKTGGSFLEQGTIAILDYDYRIMFMLIAFFGQAVGVAAYPFMARLIKEKKIKEFNELLNQVLKFLMIVIPFSVLFIVLRHEIIYIAFKRGKFDLQDVIIGSQILPFFMIGAFAYTAQTIVARGYYANEQTVFPTLVNTIIVIISLPVYYILVKLIQAKGLALGLTMTSICQTLILYELWNKKTLNTEKKQVYIHLLKISAISFVIWLIIYQFTSFLQTTFNNTYILDNIIIAVLTGLVFMILLFSAGFFFKIKEVN